jgi:D-sedoheptulose 7-phosphate isomerase
MIQLDPARTHLAALVGALVSLEEEIDRLERWGEQLGDVLLGGGRLLCVGNGGSAAQCQHLTAELVGRYRDDDRPPLSALALHAETSSLTAITNDYGAEAAYARQVRAHGRPGDVLLALSTSGESANVLAAVAAAHGGALTAWALTGPAPNALVAQADDAIAVDAPTAATVQEAHQVCVHLLCEAVERRVSGIRVVTASELLDG